MVSCQIYKLLQLISCRFKRRNKNIILKLMSYIFTQQYFTLCISVQLYVYEYMYIWVYGCVLSVYVRVTTFSSFMHQCAVTICRTIFSFYVLSWEKNLPSRGLRLHPVQMSVFDVRIKPSYGEAPVLEVWGMWSTLSLSSLLGPKIINCK